MVTSTATRKAASRDSEATRQRILRGVGRLLARRGFLGLGINAVAREARVDKVLIYRYFGGLPELLGAYASQGDFWPGQEELTGTRPQPTGLQKTADASVAALKGLLRGLRKRSMTQEVLRWELAGPRELTEKLAEVRERRGLEMLRAIAPDAALPPETDAAAMAALLSAGVIYLVLRSKTAPEWLGVPLHGEEGWARIEQALETLVRRALGPPRTRSGRKEET
jgi:AcrR family transcriptional regulator